MTFLEAVARLIERGFERDEARLALVDALTIASVERIDTLLDITRPLSLNEIFERYGERSGKALIALLIDPPDESGIREPRRRPPRSGASGATLVLPEPVESSTEVVPVVLE